MEVDEAALESLATDPEVLTIEENLAVKPLLENSTLLIGAPHAWDQGYAGSGQTIAILDTGVDKDHLFLSGKVVSEACYSGSGGGTSLCPEGVRESILPGSGAPCPSSLSDCFHGTAVAGVAAGQGTEFSGVARDARIIAIQVFSQCGEDCIESSNSDWLAGLERVLELSADFDVAAVNMSFGGGLFSEDCDADFPAVKAAMDNLRAVAIAPVAASGNDGSGTDIQVPACISSVVSVGSTDGIGDETPREEVSDFSNSSPSLDLLAPGRGIHTSVPGGDFASFNGTSLAVPHVSGAWAVLKSKAPNATAPQLLSMVSRTGIPITDPRNGLVKPRIQVDAALDVVIPELSYSSGTLLTLTPKARTGASASGSGADAILPRETGAWSSWIPSSVSRPSSNRLGPPRTCSRPRWRPPPRPLPAPKYRSPPRSTIRVRSMPVLSGWASTCPPILTLLSTTFGLPLAFSTRGWLREDPRPAAGIFRFLSVSAPVAIFWGPLWMTWIGLPRRARPTTPMRPIRDRLKSWLPGSAGGRSCR